jgi:2-oxoglutarate ferredoxin oxidoreductase subunit alpha
MGEKKFIEGNEAVCVGAISAGCRAFFGYPITPQNEVPEIFSRELPKAGGVFVQAESETAAINMLMGGSMTGYRVITSTSGPGFSLMQEGISNISAFEIPAVIVEVSRMGPGQGTAQVGQTDYRIATKGGGHGGHRCIVLAPASVQEIADLIQLAFYLSDKYSIVAIVLMDAVLGRLAEPVDINTLDFGPLPEDKMKIRGKDARDGKPAEFEKRMFPWVPGGVVDFHQRQIEKYQAITAEEIRYQAYRTQDADILIVAYGYVARSSRRAVDMARKEGIKAGLFRPITLWPFPAAAIRDAGVKAGRVLVAEDSQGQLVEDVESAMQGKAPVNLLGVWGRHIPAPAGMIHPERILEEVNALL